MAAPVLGLASLVVVVLIVIGIVLSMTAWNRKQAAAPGVPEKDFVTEAPGMGSDGKRYVVRLTGPTQFIGADDQGRPKLAFMMRLRSCSVDGYGGAISRPGKGHFHLDALGVDVVLDNPAIDPTP